MITQTRKAACSVAASLIANEVNLRRRRFAPTATDDHAVTDELARIVNELRLQGIAAEPFVEAARPIRKRPSRSKNRGRKSR